MLWDYGRGPLGPRSHEVENGLPEGVIAVHGHFRPGRYESVQPAFRFTFLRHPVDLLVSLYFFWRDIEPHDQPLHDRFLAERPEIEDFASWPKITRFQSETFFGDYDMGRFDFIGFHESRARDIARLNEAAGLQLDPTRHDNATIGGTEERQALREDKRRMGLLTDALADDIRFYDRLRAARGG